VFTDNGDLFCSVKCNVVVMKVVVLFRLFRFRFCINSSFEKGRIVL